MSGLVWALAVASIAATPSDTPDADPPPDGGAVTYSVTPRPLVGMFLHYASKGEVEDTSTVLEVFDRTLEARTGTRRARLPASFVAQCAASFAQLDLCVFATLFPELDPRRADTPLLEPEAARRAVEKDPSSPRVVFNVALSRSDKRGKSVRFRIFSAGDAAAALARAQREARAAGAPLDPFELQAVLREVTVAWQQTGRDDLTDRRLFADVFDAAQKLLEAYPPRARLTLDGAAAKDGTIVSVDGRELGPLPTAGATLADVLPGLHTVSVRADGYESAEVPVTVAAGESKAITYRLFSPGGRVLNQGVLYGGAVVGLAGVGVLGWALSKSSSVRCAQSEVSGESPSLTPACEGGLATSGGVAGEIPAGGDGDLRSGAPLVPIAAGLLGAGLTWSLGTWLFTEEDEVPWLPLLVGTLVAGAAAGATAAAQ